MTITESEIAGEQKYFDLAVEVREALRERLIAAYGPEFYKVAAIVRRPKEPHIPGFGWAPDGELARDAAAAFGRFDTEEHSLYIGYRAIMDEASNVLVANWQSSAATPFYEATAEHPGEVVSRRRYEAPRNRISHIDEVVLADLSDRISALAENEFAIEDDSLLRDLERGRSHELQDIVKTIQASQSELMRQPLDSFLIIQGGPGTGKTAVALHRVSWLLYNYKEELSTADVLVIGPSPVFTKYIRELLPSLGDASIAHTDLRSLGPVVADYQEELDEVARLKGDERMAELMAVALRQRVRQVTDDYFAIGSKRIIEIGRQDIQDRLEICLDLQGYLRGRESFRNWILQHREVRRLRVATADLDTAVDRIWPRLSPQQFLEDLLGSRERLLAAAGESFSAGEISRLFRQAAARASERRWSDADIALLDEAQYLISGTDRAYRHIVLDEAQDLSPMQARSVKRRSMNGSYTVVGDLAQAAGVWQCDRWEDLAASLQEAWPAEIRTLDVGYRVPKQLYEFASQLLPDIAPNLTAPRAIRRGPSEPTLLPAASKPTALKALVSEAQRYAGHGMMVGIVAPDALHEEVGNALDDAQMRWADTARSGLSASINVVRPADAKGLEFDAVIVLWPDAIAAQHPQGLRLLYVALTRATNSLSVIYRDSPLPLAASELEERAGIENADGTEALRGQLQELRRGMTAAEWQRFMSSVSELGGE